jgi:ribosomal-protein-alanine N-acetyltransferase
VADDEPIDFTIRPMTIDDLPAVVEIDQGSFAVPWPARSFRFELQDNPVGRLMVAVIPEGGRQQVVGYIGLWNLVDEGHISTLAVATRLRRRGIGQALLREALAFLAGSGMLTASLEVRASNRAAQSLYRKFGFAVSGRRRGYYQDNGEDALVMTLDDLTPHRREEVESDRER